MKTKHFDYIVEVLFYYLNMNETPILASMGVFAVIFNEKQQVLLCHRRDKDLWNLPGGGVDIEELPDNAILREIEEEITCKSQIISLIGIYNKVKQNELVYCYLVKLIAGTPAITNEADIIKYFDITKLPENTAPNQVQRIIDAANYTGMPYFRKQ